MDNCLFCKIGKGDIKSYTLFENDKFKVFLDVNPISNGHMLIVPKNHIFDCLDMDDDTFSKMNSIIKDMSNLIKDKLNAEGLKLVQNNGIAQEIKHYHLHLIPVYKKKQNKEDVDKIFSKLTEK